MEEKIKKINKRRIELMKQKVSIVVELYMLKQEELAVFGCGELVDIVLV